MKTISKGVKREMRLISENFDSHAHEKLPAGFKGQEGQEYMSFQAITRQVAEYDSSCPLKIRQELCECISAEFNVDLKIDSSDVKLNESSLETICWVMRPNNHVMTSETLKSAPAFDFREKIQELLLNIPGGMNYFKENAEETPYVF